MPDSTRQVSGRARTAPPILQSLEALPACGPPDYLFCTPRRHSRAAAYAAVLSCLGSAAAGSVDLAAAAVFLDLDLAHAALLRAAQAGVFGPAIGIVEGLLAELGGKTEAVAVVDRVAFVPEIPAAGRRCRIVLTRIALAGISLAGIALADLAAAAAFLGLDLGDALVLPLVQIGGLGPAIGIVERLPAEIGGKAVAVAVVDGVALVPEIPAACGRRRGGQTGDAGYQTGGENHYCACHGKLPCGADDAAHRLMAYRYPHRSAPH